VKKTQTHKNGHLTPKWGLDELIFELDPLQKFIIQVLDEDSISGKVIKTNEIGSTEILYQPDILGKNQDFSIYNKSKKITSGAIYLDIEFIPAVIEEKLIDENTQNLFS
jgi:hypothetical protein